MDAGRGFKLHLQSEFGQGRKGKKGHGVGKLKDYDPVRSKRVRSSENE